MNSRDHECFRRIEQCAKTITSTSPAGRLALTSRMVRLAKDIRTVYVWAAGDLETAVPYYMRRVSGDCFRAYEEVGTPEAATSAV